MLRPSVRAKTEASLPLRYSSSIKRSPAAPNALARRQSVHLNDDGVAVPRGKRAEVGERRCFPVEGLRAGGWDAGVLHDLFGKDLRTLDARRAARGTKDLQTSLPESLSDPANERRLRTHNGEVYVDRSGEVTQ